MSTDATDNVIVRLIYTGRRHDSKQKLVYSFVLVNDQFESRLFDATKASAVGGIYEHDDPAQRVAWQAADQAARGRETRQKAERSLARRTDLDQLIEPLEEVAALCRNRHDAAALAALVSERVLAAFYRR